MSAPGPADEVIVIGPTPPPHHGVAAMTLQIVEALSEEGLLAAHLDTRDPQPLESIGVLNASNVILGIRHAWQLHRLLRTSASKAVLLPISQVKWGFLRDAVLVLVVRLHRRRLIVHLHGGGLRSFYAGSSRWMRPVIRGVFAGLVPASRVKHLSNTVPEPPFGHAARNGSSGANRPLRLLYLANLLPEKGAPELLDALEALGGAAREWRVRIVGSGPLAAERALRERVADMTGGPQIELVTGLYGDHKWREYQDADIFVFPTRYPLEGQPLVLLEAMATGLPVITTRHGGIPDTVRHEQECLLVEPGDTRGLADALLRLAGDSRLRASLAQASLERYQLMFRPERFRRDLATLLASSSTRAAAATPTHQPSR